jgi:phosphate transport system substrate-binding protein
MTPPFIFGADHMRNGVIRITRISGCTMNTSSWHAIRQRRRASVAHVELTNRLWKLKHRYQKHSGHYVQLNMLLNDHDYLASVLDNAMQSGVPDLTEIAREIRALGQQATSLAPAACCHLDFLAKPGAVPAGTVTARHPLTKCSIVFAVLALAGLLILAAALTLMWPTTPATDTPATADVSPADTSAVPINAAAAMPAPALRLHGSNTIGENLAPALVEGMLRKRGYQDVRLIDGDKPVEKTVYAVAQGSTLPALSIEVHAHGSSTAFADLLGGGATWAWRVDRSRIRTGRTAPGGQDEQHRRRTVIALDGLAVIVHPSNPISALTSTQVARLFSGEYSDWAQLGGTPGPVTVYARDDHSGTYDTFKSLVLERIKASLIPNARRFESSTDLSDLVANDPTAIGFIGLPYVRYAKVLAIAESDETLAILPTSFTVSTEDYPLSRRLFFYTPPKGGNPLAAELAQYALGSEGQSMVEKIGFISQNIRSEKPEPSPAFPAEYLELTRDAERLSLNFRFQLGSDQFDNKAQRDLQRLVDHLAQNRQQRVLLLGFTDSSAEVNQQLSHRRAVTLETALQVRGRPAWCAVRPAIAIASNDSGRAGTIGASKCGSAEILAGNTGSRFTRCDCRCAFARAELPLIACSTCT